jgi:hypothetical protein
MSRAGRDAPNLVSIMCGQRLNERLRIGIKRNDPEVGVAPARVSVEFGVKMLRTNQCSSDFAVGVNAPGRNEIDCRAHFNRQLRISHVRRWDGAHVAPRISD